MEACIFLAHQKLRNFGGALVDIDAPRRLSVAICGGELNFSFAQLTRDFDISGGDPSVDSTAYLEKLLVSKKPRHIGRATLLGELQLAFIAGVVADNAACLELWWDMVCILVLRTFLLVAERPSEASDLLRVFGHQLAFADRVEGVGCDIWTKLPPEASQELCRLLTNYKLRLTRLSLKMGAEGSQDVRLVGDAFSLIERWIGKRFGTELRGQFGCATTVDMVDKKKKKKGDESEPGEKEEGTQVPVPVTPPVPQLEKRWGCFSWE